MKTLAEGTTHVNNNNQALLGIKAHLNNFRYN